MIANLRLLVFAVGLCTAWGAWWMGWFSGAWLLLPILAFAALMIAHDRTLNALARARSAVAHYERCLARVDDRWAGIVVAFNANNWPMRQEVPQLRKNAWHLHPVHRRGADEVVRTARIDDGVLSLPAWTYATFVTHH